MMQETDHAVLFSEFLQFRFQLAQCCSSILLGVPYLLHQVFLTQRVLPSGAGHEVWGPQGGSADGHPCVCGLGA